MKHSLKLFALAIAFLLAGGLQEAWADPVTLAAWDFSNNVKYTQNSQDGAKTYYVASNEAKVNMEYTFDTQQPFFYPTSGTATNSTLT
ncbi:MAG: hypothetical protein ACI3YT_09280, partial [Prevotella sp.]